MAVIWKGGRGNRAPYRTTHLRIPDPIKGQVQALVNDWKRSALVDSPATVEDDKLEAVAVILNQALTFDGRAGTKIKDKIKEALAILEDA